MRNEYYFPLPAGLVYTMSLIRPLVFADRKLVTDFLTRYPPAISELTFTNLFVWRHSRPVYITEQAGSLLFLIEDNARLGRYLLLGPPAGPLSIAEVISAQAVALAGAIRIPKQAAADLQQAGFHVADDRDNADYVYRVADLGGLAGRRYAKKRNQIKQCLQNYHCEYEPLTSENLPECIAMQAGWCQLRACGRTPGLCGENIAIGELFSNYWQLELIGGAIRVNGEIQAYTIAEQLNPGTAVCHFEKAMPPVQGLGQLITQWFTRFSLQDFEYVNREQDLGVPGLRQAKESYFPHHLVGKYTLRLNGEETISSPEPKRCELEE